MNQMMKLEEGESANAAVIIVTLNSCRDKSMISCRLGQGTNILATYC